MVSCVSHDGVLLCVFFFFLSMVFQKRQEFFFLFFIVRFFFSLHIYLFAFYHDINGDHIHTVRQAREGKDGRVFWGRVCSLHLFLVFLHLRSCIIMSPFFLSFLDMRFGELGV